MKDGKLTEFSGLHDETCDGEITTYIGDGEITTHIDCITNDNYDTDDIEMWIEIPNVK